MIIFKVCFNFPGGFSCICEPGFALNDAETCENIDECFAGTHSCDPNALCVDLNGLHSCHCNEGFTGNGISCVTGPTTPDCTCGETGCDLDDCVCREGFEQLEIGVECTDINECLVDHNCGANSKCFNFLGGFTCGCLNGFKFEDFSQTECVDVDECQEETDICSKNAECHNFEGGYNCHCKAGFTGNGLTCEDIDECESNLNDCSQNGECSNTVGSFTCKCKDGFEDKNLENTGKICTAIGEPCIDGSHLCSVNALCESSDVENGYECVCTSGFTGNGFECIDIDECDLDTHNCLDSQVCANNVGSFSCECPSGFLGNGNTCIDIDECSEETHQCTANSVCQNTIGDYVCVCELGFGGNMCTDIDECVLETHNCHENASCQNNVGSYTCKCDENFEGGGFFCEATKPVVSTESPGHTAIAFGDPHFVFETDENEKLCFNYDGTLEHAMLLVADPVSGLYITGILERAGRAKAFKEIHILTPEGVSVSVSRKIITIVKEGRILSRKSAGEMKKGEIIDIADVYISWHLVNQDWEITIGTGVKLHVMNKHVRI